MDKKTSHKNKDNKDENRSEILQLTSFGALQKIDAKYRGKPGILEEVLPFAREATYVEIARRVLKDRDATKQQQMVHRIMFYKIIYPPLTGVQTLLTRTSEYLAAKNTHRQFDILSVCGGIENNTLTAMFLIRCYEDEDINVDDLYKHLDRLFKKAKNKRALDFSGLNVEDAKEIEYSKDFLLEHQKIIDNQHKIKDETDYDVPFLNKLEDYEPETLPQFDESRPLMYLYKQKEKNIATVLSYEDFYKIFSEAIIYLTDIERESYYKVLNGKGTQESFMTAAENYIRRVFVIERQTLPEADVPMMLKKIENAMFALYIIQGLIDDRDITDIKITDPYSIRVRIKGRAYLSDITFAGESDYFRFVNSLIIRNNVDTSVPEQTFTDEHDADYKLRFTITMPYVTMSGFPVLHIRKVPRKKMLSQELMDAGMFDNKVRKYILDCGQNSTGIIFAGPPGSGKTVLLNWFLEEAYEDSAEILVIQENDELFSAGRRGVVFQHVVPNPVGRRRACNLEELSQLALVAGANVFIIGEVKGAEICSAMTLANSGCRIGMTVHSRSAEETTDKMADLALRGHISSITQAKRMLKCFQTIVYVQDFKVQEISEIIGFDEDKKDVIFRKVYKREE